MRKRGALAGFVQLLALLLSAGTVAFAAKTSPEILRVSELRPGMKGYGLTVFRGTEPERFPVEIIDILHGFRPNQELILIRTPHPILEKAQIVAGMSGSPVYIDGKLIGAYAYGFAFSAEPIAGVTPAEIMLKELKRPVRSRPDWRGLKPSDRLAGVSEPSTTSRSKRTGPSADAQEARASASTQKDAVLKGFRLGPNGELPTALERLKQAARTRETEEGLLAKPVASPLMASGFTPRTARLIEEIFTEHGFIPFQGAGGGLSTPDASARFVDGGALSVILMSGDMNLSAVGTVTHVDEATGRLIAFGHPMMNQGEVFLPTGVARVLHILASVQRSFKIAEPVRPLGTLVHDRQSAIVVDQDTPAETVPVSIKLIGVDDAPKTEWNVEVVQHRLLTTPLAFTALSNAIDATMSDRMPIRVRARSTLYLRGRAPIVTVDEGTMSQGPGASAPLRSLRGFTVMEAAYSNPFGEELPERLEIEVEIRRNERPERIVDISTPRTRVEAGSTIPVLVRLARFGENERIERVEIPIPTYLAGQKAKLSVMPSSQLPRAAPRFTSFDSFIRYVEEARPNTSLSVALTLPARGLRFEEHVTDRLPASVLAALQGVSSTAPSRPFESVSEHHFPFDRVFDGRAELELFIEEKRP